MFGNFYKNMCSVVRCEYCNRNIDTDYDAEHFDSADDSECVNEEMDNEDTEL